MFKFFGLLFDILFIFFLLCYTLLIKKIPLKKTWIKEYLPRDQRPITFSVIGLLLCCLNSLDADPYETLICSFFFLC